MDITPHVISEIVTTVLAALRTTNTVDSPENAAVKAPYRKHIFWLQERDDEENLVVAIQAKITVKNDCNTQVLHVSEPRLVGTITATPAGYYQVETPDNEFTPRLRCTFVPARTRPLWLRGDSVIEYASDKPIVIHAHKDIDLSYEIQEKPPVVHD
ncbi:hypothetical protein C4K03_1208 [Pseudomonas synxantha]|uniref:Uncharacterized protein n=1 Tax=Pseudomonas synxantha TaxID=47883 RepID=A0A3G7U478_9PSED|nr:ecotin family protein [Pseudomonas synxantha]AZE53379.1 hypothetical protein C4K03_1208 [Pseudomonas synxantha]